MLGLVLLVRLLLSEHVYSVSELLADLQREPAGWQGRTVLVHGITTGSINAPCPGGVSSSCPSTLAVLFSDSAAGPIGISPSAGRQGWAPAATMVARNGHMPGGKVLEYALFRPVNTPPLVVMVPLAKLAALENPPAPWPYVLPIIGHLLWQQWPPDQEVTVRVRIRKGLPCLLTCADAELAPA
jgi:hypothetical protein